MKEARKRSDGIILVGYFLSRCTDFSDGRVPRPPTSLRVGRWNSAYDLFFDELSDGRSKEQFRHTLRNTRDIFDALFDNGRKGWSDGQKRGSELSERDEAVHAYWVHRSDDALLREVLRFSGGAPRARNPHWTRDELIVVLDYYLNHPDYSRSAESEEILALSDRVAKVGQALGLASSEAHLRTPNSIEMKLRNFSSLDVSYTENGRKGLNNGNSLEYELWQEFSGRPEYAAQVARNILRSLKARGVDALALEDDEHEATEGRILTRVHLSRERNSSVVKKKKDFALSKFGCLACEVCGFDFFKMYGERGLEFIECHHIVPVSSLDGDTMTRLRDLALVCANCHRMIHARRPWWSIDEVRAAFVKAGRSETKSQ